MVNLRIATSERWRDKSSGENKERTEWHSVAIFNENLVRIAEQYLRKGSKVYIEGQLETRKWQDQSGQDVLHRDRAAQYRGELTLLDGRGEGGGGGADYDQDRGGSFGGSGGGSGGGGGGRGPAGGSTTRSPSEDRRAGLVQPMYIACTIHVPDGGRSSAVGRNGARQGLGEVS